MIIHVIILEDASKINIHPDHKSRWWFQTFYIFTPIWGRFPIWRTYFSIGLVQPPTRNPLTSGIFLATLRRKCFASADAAFVAICLIGVLIEPSDFVGTVGTVEWIAQRLYWYFYSRICEWFFFAKSICFPPQWSLNPVADCWSVFQFTQMSPLLFRHEMIFEIAGPT